MKKVVAAILIACVLTTSAFAHDEVAAPPKQGVLSSISGLVGGLVKTIFSVVDGVVMIGYYRTKDKEMALLKVDMRKETEIKADKL